MPTCGASVRGWMALAPSPAVAPFKSRPPPKSGSHLDLRCPPQVKGDKKCSEGLSGKFLR
jgi:hypothetical protein